MELLHTIETNFTYFALISHELWMDNQLLTFLDWLSVHFEKKPTGIQSSRANGDHYLINKSMSELKANIIIRTQEPFEQFSLHLESVNTSDMFSDLI